MYKTVNTMLRMKTAFDFVIFYSSI